MRCSWRMKLLLLTRLSVFLYACSLGYGEGRQLGSGYFEGTLEFVASEYAADGRALARERITLFVTPRRLLFPSLDASEPFANYAPPGVESLLVRNDKNDLILYGEGYDAYRFKGYDMTLLGLAFKTLAVGGMPTQFEGPENGGKFELRGHPTELFRYRGEGDVRIDAYFTNDFRVNWGALSGSWLFGSGGLKIEMLDSLLEQGQVPVRLEAYSNGARLMSLNLVRSEEAPVPETTVSIPHPKVLRSSTRLLIDLARN